MTTLSKKILVKRLEVYGLGHTQQELGLLVNDVLSIMVDQLLQGESLNLSKLGNFEVMDKVARVGRNPKTKEAVIISRRKVIRFSPSPKLTSRLNKR